MPASATALRISGIASRPGFDNSAALAHPTSASWAIVIPVPVPWPIGNVLSVGDLIIFVGALCRAARRRDRACRGCVRAAGRARISRDARGSTAGI